MNKNTKRRQDTMHTAKITRKDLKVHFKDFSTVMEPANLGIADNIDLLPVVRLLSAVNIEQQVRELTA